MDFYSLQNQLLPLLNSNKNIAIRVSGGFDSGLLLYSCVKTSLEHSLQNTFTAITVPRYDDSFVHSNNIVNWIEDHFLVDIKVLKSGNPNLHHSQQTWSGILENINNFDIILMGCTTNPSHLKNGPNRPRVNNKKVFQPFYDLTKKDTVKLVIDLKLEQLMILSHTCTESKNLRCGQCWQCKERQWAFEVNNFTDPGSL